MATPWNSRGLLLLHELRMRGTLSAVAAARSYSASTVSHQLQQLEREVGLPLLEPEGRGLRLTAAGEAVARHAAQLLAAEEALRGELAALAPDAAPLRIAALQTSARTLIPRMLDALRDALPALRVEVIVTPPEHGLFETEAGGFDLAMAEQYPGHTRPHRAGLDRELLGRDPIRFAAGPASGIASLSDAREAAWVMEPEGTAARAWAVQQCRAAGFEPDIRYEATDLSAHLRLIAAGHAVGLIPGLAVAADEAEPRLVDLPGSPHREIFTSTRVSAQRLPGLRIARDALAEAFRSLPET
ncbi:MULTISPECIES: LysR family transcriptional regulator [Microbacterium]|uniref:LysR family transcriptional regulator n=1 Tax=Microbacterium barkeri TaxID=33917 RepID=A0A9W6H5I2_9MICO|nr:MULTISPECIES: LysR family transcriptional regulator [Microbacterium]MDR6877241.1 DNA-binding transcriptional LysR family regulator [Microbacterium barkeri]WRH16436.1 LysR family transcriptional regulator [Microbacterium sp. JZ37]GLJ62662.1 LysR family transcriptional regulator [Microbacterium barkeri]